MINSDIFKGIIIPFLGTTLGSACVIFMKSKLNSTIQRSLTGFAAGVMTAASVWSLLIPSMDMSEDMGRLAFVPSAAGFMLGIVFLLMLDRLIPHLHMNTDKTEGLKANLKKTTLLVLTVTIHNFPEGMAVGAVFAGFMSDNSSISLSSAFVLSLGIAIQNFPEGAIISMPLKAEGMSRKKAFLTGILSGAVEPAGAFLILIFSGVLTPVLPYFLSFAAGAMIYVVVEELIPEMSVEPHSNMGVCSFSAGFVVMMTLDVALG